MAHPNEDGLVHRKPISPSNQLPLIASSHPFTDQQQQQPFSSPSPIPTLNTFPSQRIKLGFFILALVLSLSIGHLLGSYYSKVEFSFTEPECHYEKAPVNLRPSFQTTIVTHYIPEPVKSKAMEQVLDLSRGLASDDPCTFIISSQNSADICESCQARHPSCGWCAPTKSCHYGSSEGPFLTSCPVEWYKPSENICPSVYREKPLAIAGFIRSWTYHHNGGMERHGENIYKSLAAMGHTIAVFATAKNGYNYKRPDIDQTDKLSPVVHDFPDTGGRLTIYPVPGTSVQKYTENYYKNSYKYFLQINKEIAKKNGHGFDVVHSESVAAGPLNHLFDIPTVYTHHGTYFDHFRNTINLAVSDFISQGVFPSVKDIERAQFFAKTGLLESTWLQTFARHIVISEQAASDLINIAHVPSDRVHLVFNGVDTSAFTPNPTLRKQYRDKMGVSDDTIVIGSAGKLRDTKGHPWLVNVVGEITKAHPNVQVWIAGAGIYADKYVEKYKNDDRIHYVGNINPMDMPEYYNAVDIFLDAANQHHGFNTVLLEAIACGKPVLACDIGSVSQTLGPSNSLGGIFPLGNTPAFLELVSQLVNMGQDGLEKLGMSNKQRFQGKFTLESMARGYEQVLLKAIDEKINNHVPSGVNYSENVFCDDVAVPTMCWRPIQE